MNFHLHPRLHSSTILAGHLDQCLILLKNDRRFPWFIIVPQVPSHIQDLDQLTPPHLANLTQTIQKISHFTRNHFNSQKINIASIGNIVPQLHIHIVGRNPTDPAWPGVVWSHPGTENYPTNEAQKIILAFELEFPIKSHTPPP